MEKSKKYWAVFKEKAVVFDGTFTQCWEYLLQKHHASTLGELDAEGIKIARKS